MKWSRVYYVSTLVQMYKNEPIKCYGFTTGHYCSCMHTLCNPKDHTISNRLVAGEKCTAKSNEDFTLRRVLCATENLVIDNKPTLFFTFLQLLVHVSYRCSLFLAICICCRFKVELIATLWTTFVLTICIITALYWCSACCMQTTTTALLLLWKSILFDKCNIYNTWYNDKILHYTRITKNLQFKKGVGIDPLSLQQKVREQVGS